MNHSKKRVLIVCHHFWPESFRITDIALGFIENDFLVDVLCGIPNYPSGRFFKGYGYFKKRRQNYNGIRIIRVPEIPRGGNSNFRIFINYISFPFFAMFYVPLLLMNRYDRIFIYQLSPVYMALPGIILGKLNGIKTFMYVLDLWPDSLLSILKIKSKFLLKLVTRTSYWHYRRVDGIMGAFKGIQTRLIDDVGIKKEKTLYIPQAPEKIYELQEKDPVLESRLGPGFKIMYAGNISPAQSWETILSAVDMVKAAGYTQIKYVIIGDGMSKNWLVKEVVKKGLSDDFIFEGFRPVEEIPKYQTEADALIIALLKDPVFEYAIPAKVQSYMASGKPIIAAIAGDCKRLINESGSGLCCDSEDSNCLAEIIIQTYNMNDESRYSMGQKGRNYHFTHFERNYNLNRIIEFVFNDNRIIDNEYPALNKLNI